MVSEAKGVQGVEVIVAAMQAVIFQSHRDEGWVAISDSFLAWWTLL